MSGEVQQGPTVTWTQFNHRYESGRTLDGYAVCTNCGTHENEPAIIKPCKRGPLLTPRLDKMMAIAKRIDAHVECAESAPLHDDWTQFKLAQGMETDALETLIRSRNMIQCECGELIEVGSIVPDHPVLLCVKCDSCGAQVRTFEAIKQGLEKRAADAEDQIARMTSLLGDKQIEVVAQVEQMLEQKGKLGQLLQNIRNGIGTVQERDKTPLCKQLEAQGFYPERP